MWVRTGVAATTNDTIVLCVVKFDVPPRKMHAALRDFAPRVACGRNPTGDFIIVREVRCIMTKMYCGFGASNELGLDIES